MKNLKVFWSKTDIKALKKLAVAGNIIATMALCTGCDEGELQPTTYKLNCGDYYDGENASMLCNGHMIECKYNQYSYEMTCTKLEEKE